jgi:hypothetical protein
VIVAGSAASGRKTVTLRDVAALADVSVATASKALNGRENVHPATRQRVVDAAARLRFQPNALAKHLPQGRSGTVGLITHDLEGRFSIPILMGAEDAFGAGKMSVFLCDSREDAIRESYHLQALLGRRVDGLIAVGSRTDPRPSLGHDLPVPVVAAVNGHAIGAGFQLALSCDIRILAEDAKFTMKEPALGLVPDLTGTKPLVDIVGVNRAVEICLTARRVEAAEARELGLAELVVPVDELDGAVDDVIAALLATNPEAATATKALLQQAAGNTLQEQARAERRAQVDRLTSLAKAMGAGS